MSLLLRKWSWLGAGLALAALCAPAGAQTRTGNVIVYANTAGPGTLDPYASSNTFEQETVNHIYEGIIALDERYRAAPMLAERMVVSPDAATYTFPLRRGVKFHNGKEMTAADVVASFRRYAAVSTNKALLSDVASYETPDAYTFIIKLKNPNPVFDVMLASASFPLGIMPAELESKPAREVDIIGTGPFKMGEYQKDSHLVLPKFDGYVPRNDPGPDGNAGRKTVRIDALRYTFVPEANSRVASLRAGESDVAGVIPPELAKSLEGQAALGVETVFPGCMSVSMMHSQNPPTDNPLIRRAISAAINADEVMAGAGQIAKRNPSLLYGDSVYYDEKVAAPFYDQRNIARAKALLAEAGYKGEKVTLLTNSTYLPMRDSILVIAEQLKAAGINAQVEIVDAVAAFARTNQGTKNWNMNSGWYCSQPLLGPQQWRPFIYNQNQVKGDAKLDALYDRFLTSPKVEDRKAAWSELEAYLLGEQTYMLKISDFGTQYAYNKRLKGLKPWYLLRFWDVSVQ